jgi:hypothetical protein
MSRRSDDETSNQGTSSEPAEESWNDLFGVRGEDDATTAPPGLGWEALPLPNDGAEPDEAAPTGASLSLQPPDDGGATEAATVRPSRPSRRYTLAQVNEVGAALRALPARDPYQRRFNKLAAIAEIADEITALQSRGYTLGEVAGILTAEGVEVTLGTLKEYLQRIRIRREKAAQRARRSKMPLVLRGHRR